MYAQISKIVEQILQINTIANNAAIQKLPALHLAELNNIENYDTHIITYNLQIFGDTEEQVRTILHKLNEKHVFEVSDTKSRAIFTLQSEFKTVVTYKDHIFQAEKIINVQKIQTRVTPTTVVA